MEQTPAATVEQSQQMSALSGVLQVLFAPSKVFASVRQMPNWILPLIIFTALVVIVTLILYPTIRTEILNNVTNNPDLNEEQRAQLVEQVSGRLTLGWILGPGLVFQLIIYFVVAAVFFFVANILMGGEGNFPQLLSITGLSQMVMIPEDLVKVPIILAKQTIKVHTDLSLFLPTSMEESFVLRLLSQLDIFTFWKVFLIGLGTAVVYKFTNKKAMTAAFVIWGIYILLAALMGKFLNFGMG